MFDKLEDIKSLVAALLILGLVATVVIKNSEIKSLKQNIKTLESSLTICKGNVASLTDSVDSQNKAIKALKAKGDTALLKSAEDLKIAQKKANKSTSNAVKIQTAQPKSNNLCLEATNLIDTEIENNLR